MLNQLLRVWLHGNDMDMHAHRMDPCTQGVVEGDGRYLLPLLPGGPNNQALAFRQAVALALMLNRTVLLTGIVEHPSTARSSSDGDMRRPIFYRMEDLYNW